MGISNLLGILLGLLIVAAVACTAPQANAQAVRMEQAMVIDGVIMGNNLEKIRSALLATPNGGEVDLVINSPGGSVSTGFDFVSVMEATKARGVVIRCYVANMAASMAFQILLHCHERHVLERSLLLWHRARIMLGGRGGPMTGPQMEVLSGVLTRMDALIFEEVTRYVYMGETESRYHFENETMHIGKQLSDSTGSFYSHESISGLYEALANEKLPRTVEESPFFFGGGDVATPGIAPAGTTVPWRTDLDKFTFGEIIYIK